MGTGDQAQGLRVLVLASEWPPAAGGVAALSLEQAVGLARLGCHVRVEAISTGLEPDWEQAQPQDVPGLEIRRQIVRNRAVLRLPRLIRLAVSTAGEYRPDVILCPAYRGFGLPARIAAARSGTRLALYFHGTELRTDGRRGIRRALLRLCLKGADILATNSNNTATILERLLPAGSAEVRSLPPGARLTPFADPATANLAEATRLEWLKQAGVSQEESGRTLVFLSVCRLFPGKGLDIAIMALARLVESTGGNQRLVFVIAGKGPQEHELRQLASNLGLEKRVVFHGPVAYGQTAPLYMAADGYLQPSQPRGDFLESYGISFVEAQAAGLPCIGTNWGGVPEATRPGETAWLVQTGSVAAVAEAMEKFCRLTADERAIIAFRGRVFAATRSWEAHCQRLLDLLTQSVMSPAERRCAQ